MKTKKVTKKTQKSAKKPTPKPIPQYLEPTNEDLLSERNMSPRFLDVHISGH